MKLDKAIEILAEGIKDYKEPAIYDFQRAIKLGIEALKRHQALKRHPYFEGLQLLPGED